MKNTLKALPFLGALLATDVAAADCNVNVNYGVIIDPAHVRVLKNNLTHVQINGSHQLFIDGREIPLNSEQQAILASYTAGIRKQVPEIVSIAIEGLELGLKTVNNVIGGLTGENSASQQKFQENLNEVKWRLRSRFNHTDSNYYIGPQEFANFDDIFTGEFEQEIEEIVTESVGSILMAVGSAMNNEDGIEGTKIENTTLDQKIENISENIELNIGPAATRLQQKAAEFCIGLIALDDIEDELQTKITQLSHLNLIDSSK